MCGNTATIFSVSELERTVQRAWCCCHSNAAGRSDKKWINYREICTQNTEFYPIQTNQQSYEGKEKIVLQIEFVSVCHGL